MRPASVLLGLLLLLCAAPRRARAWFHEADHRCLFHCARAGGCGQGKARLLKTFRTCENYLYRNRFLGRGPGACRAPNFIGDRPFARKFFELRVCRNEIYCIAQAVKRKTRGYIEQWMVRVLRVRARSNALRDELRFSRDRAYVRATDKLTDLRTRAELLAFIAAGGKVDARSRLANPIYRKVARYLGDNARMRKRLSSSRLANARRARDKARTRYLNVVRGKFDTVMATRSRLRGKQYARQVHEWLKEIKLFARRIDMMQDEAIEVRFYRSEYTEVRAEVHKHQRDVYALKDKVAALRKERVLVRARLARDKKRLVDALRSLSRQVIASQDKHCPVQK